MDDIDDPKPTTRLELQLNCPHCGYERPDCIDSSIDKGFGTNDYYTCPECNGQFVVEMNTQFHEHKVTLVVTVVKSPKEET